MFAMRKRRVTLKKLICAFGVLSVFAAQAESKVIAIHPGPIAGETMVLDDARGVPWCEIAPATGTPPALTVHVYNSTSVDVCPREHSAHLDAAKLARQMGVPKVVLNQGRYWTMDRMTAFTAGETLEIEGVRVKWAATMTADEVSTLLAGKPYSVVTIQRDTEWLYRAGRPVWVLRAPDGKVWVMQTFGKDKDPTLSLDTLDTLAGKLQLPQGWRFDTVVPERDLSLQPRRAKGIAHILRDDLGNAYQGCGYDATCNFVP